MLTFHVSVVGSSTPVHGHPIKSGFQNGHLIPSGVEEGKAIGQDITFQESMVSFMPMYASFA